MLPGARKIRGPAEGLCVMIVTVAPCLPESPGNVSAILGMDTRKYHGNTMEIKSLFALDLQAAGSILKAFEEGPMTSLEASLAAETCRRIRLLFLSGCLI